MVILKKIKLGLLILGVLAGSTHTRADHITGGEMYYRYSGKQGDNHIYNVTLRLLMRCNSGRVFPNPIMVSVFDKEDGFRVLDIPVTLETQGVINLQNNNPCISNPPLVCYDVATYNFDVAVLPNVPGYVIAAQINFRVNGLANVSQGFGNIGATYTAEIPGTSRIATAQVNTSAKFDATDLVIVCANSPFTYSFAASDGDNDQLRYSFCSAYQSGTSIGGSNTAPPVAPPYPLVPYGQGFSGSSPLGNRVTIDPNTGLVKGVAPAPGIYVVTVCVEEIRNGVVIATQRKDIQLNITSCTVAAAILPAEFQLCGETKDITVENLSISPLIQTYAWRLTDRSGNTVATSAQPRFVYSFADTGLYRIHLQTNQGLICPDSSSAPILVYPGFKAGFEFAGLCFGNPTRFRDQTTTIYGTVKDYSWDLGETSNAGNEQRQANPVITYQSLGNKLAYLLVVNTNGCRDSLSKSFVISREPPIQVSWRDTLICPPDTLQVNVLGEGIFNWDPAPGLLTGINSPNPSVAPQTTTWYRVTQRLDDCIGRDSIRVRVVNNVVLNAMPDTTICLGDTVQLSIQTNATRIEWAPDPSLGNANLNPAVAEPIAPTVYSVTGFVSQCFATDEIRVNTVPYPTAIAGPSQHICFGNEVRLSSESNGNRLVWSPAATINNPQSPNPVAKPTQSTTYVLQVYDNKGCPKPGVDSVQIIVEPPVMLRVTTDTSVVVGQLLQFNASGASRYLWSPGNGLSSTIIPNPTVTYSQPADRVQYLLVGYNDAGCRDSLRINVRVFANGPSIYVPTAFTPNGDGLNETLKLTLAGMQRLEYFRVYNRFGELVFSSYSLYDAWDGSRRGQKQPSGNYIWVVQAIDFEGKVVQTKGSTVLIR